MQKNTQMFQMIRSIKEGKMTMEQARGELSSGEYKKLTKAMAADSQLILAIWPF